MQQNGNNLSINCLFSACYILFFKELFMLTRETYKKGYRVNSINAMIFMRAGKKSVGIIPHRVYHNSFFNF